jgi:hypothetical protein
LIALHALFDRVACVKSDESGHRRIVVVSAVGPIDRRTMRLEAGLTMSSARSGSTPAARPNPG